MSIYHTRRWTYLRRAVLIRDAYKCQIGGPRCRVVANAVDHIVEVWEGGDEWDPANLRAACVSCNSAKHMLSITRRKNELRRSQLRKW
jgi:5-methylcytosine-specific restriction endonuclease McrA